MEELIDISRSLLNQKGRTPDVAKVVAEWALPGNRYNEKERKFEPSGLSLEPFLELIDFARDNEIAESCSDRTAYELCA